jgi:DNA-binding transcriptional LysR family regulator
MRTRYVRRRPKRSDDAAAAAAAVALGVGVGAVAFYFVRMLLSRETVSAREELEKRDARRP